MSYMDYNSAKQIALYIECKSEWEAFDRDGNIIIGRKVRACFASLKDTNSNDIASIKIYMYAYDPKLSLGDNVLHDDRDTFERRFYPVTDLPTTMMRKILNLAKSIVDFAFTINTERIVDENGNNRRQYCINLLFPSDTNVVQKLFVCTVVRWFYEQQNRYIALKAYELYNTEKYHRFGFFNLYCLVKLQCSDNVNYSGHDLLDGKKLACRVLYAPEKFRSLYKMSSLLHNGGSITSLCREIRHSEIPVKNTAMRVTEMYCKGGTQEFDLQERLENNIDFIISKVKKNETFDCEDEEQ